MENNQMTKGNGSNLIQIKNLKKHFKIGGGLKGPKTVYAVDGVTFDIKKGETFGLVGESGCGKTTLGRTLLRLYEPTAGTVTYDGDVIFDENNKKNNPKMLPFRRKMQIIFQDPSASLDPRMTVGEIIGEALDIHKLHQGKDRADRINQLLDRVGLNSEHSNRYPHEFSGGQQQRIGIARALAVEPEFIVCDEPISALDVSIQSQVVNMLEDMQDELGLTYLFIAHDLSVVRHISDRIGVMYLGNMVELGNGREMYADPIHPYTKTLLSAVPIPDPKANREKKRIILEGEIPSPMNPPTGCKFHTRCPFATDVCKQEAPEWREVKDRHFVACHNV